jgi:hypothetical protein
VLTLGGNVIVTGGQLQTLDLTGVAFQGANVSIVATLAPGGNGLVNVGYINATGRDLGAVLIDGDLGAIDAGDPANPASACKGLSVASFGRFGLSTEGGVGDLISNFDGKLDRLIVKTDVKDAFVSVTDSVAANGKIGAVSVGGSLIGGAENISGGIFARDGIGSAAIKGDIAGGTGITSGALTATGNIGSITLAARCSAERASPAGHLQRARLDRRGENRPRHRGRRRDEQRAHLRQDGASRVFLSVGRSSAARGSKRGKFTAMERSDR